MKNKVIGKENQGKTCYSFPMFKSLIPDTHQRIKKQKQNLFIWVCYTHQDFKNMYFLKFTFRSWSSLIAWDTKNVYKWILILYKAFDDGKDLDLSKILIKN